MKKIEFCPMCGSLQHKLVILGNNTHFCKECNKFFTFEHIVLRCPKCNSPNLVDSDFPSPEGELIFHCKGCRKMYSSKEIIPENLEDEE